MDFKKFASDAGAFMNRAKQYTEEKLGHAEKTELDAQFENLAQRAERTRVWTERMLAHTEAVLQPNPTARVESLLYDKLGGPWEGGRRRGEARETPAEAFGRTLLEAGGDFGPGTQYGGALVRVGQTQQKLGQAERELLLTATNNFLQPLRAFLDGDMKTVQKERGILEKKRLDLDACKTRLRRAKSLGAKDQTQEQIIADAEAELRAAQGEFDRQVEITRLLLEGITSTHAHHLRCLHDLVAAQTSYYSQCQQHLADLQSQLSNYSAVRTSVPKSNGSTAGAGSTTGVGSSTSLSPGISAPTPPLYPSAPSSSTPAPSRRAKVLYDYEALDISELSLVAEEVITVYSIPGQEDWVMGERGAHRGKVPTTYIIDLH